MTLTPTPHQVQTGAHRLHAWCAADALDMLRAIGRTVQVSSACPATGQTVTVTAGPDGVQDVQPPGAVVSVITGDPDDTRGSLCNLGHFFASPDAASGWAGEHPDGALLTVPDAFRVDPRGPSRFQGALRVRAIGEPIGCATAGASGCRS